MKDKFKFCTGRDLIVILALLVAAGALYFTRPADKTKAVRVEILADGEIEETVELSSVGNLMLREVNGVVICIEKDRVSVVSSPCADKICVNTGEISKAGEFICCAPQRVLVRIAGEDAPDAVAY